MNLKALGLAGIAVAMGAIPAVAHHSFAMFDASKRVTVAGTVAQTFAEALAGLAFVQLVNPGAPVVLGSFASSILVSTLPSSTSTSSS